MRRVLKPITSAIIKERLIYKIKGDNKRLTQILNNEQHCICAYTELHLGRGVAMSVDHFDPTLKGTKADSYENWFLVSAEWNNEKSKKWSDYQPVLDPTDVDFEQRIIYIDSSYAAADPVDIYAANLVRLLKLDDSRMATRRKAYIKRKKEEIAERGISSQQFIDKLLVDYPEGIYFIRALEEELNVKVNFDLLKST